MDENNFLADDNITKKSSTTTKIDDFANLKGNTMDFLSHERSEKFDEEKPKVDVDDFLNFHDNFDEAKPHPQPQPSQFSVPNIEKNDEIIDEPYVTQPEPEPEIDFHAIDDDYLNTLKGFETNKEKFISSEDLMTDFKDPAPAPAVEVEAPAPPKAVVPEKPPVTEPIKPVVEPPKPKSAPPPAPVKQKSSDDTQIEAEKIFKNIGLG